MNTLIHAIPCPAYNSKRASIAMDRVGVSFAAPLSADEVHARYIHPLRTALEASRAGIYSNYLRQVDEDGAPPEHLLMFQVRDFEEGLRLLRTTLDKIGAPTGMMFHNLNVSNPMY